MLSTANITIQFGAKPLFENVSVKFGDGNRYGLIGANGCGKTTFMKILGGDLEQSSGEVMLDRGERLGKLRQDQFAFEDMRVLDVVMMGHAEMWEAMSARDAIYANPVASEEDYMRAADLEATFAEYDGYTAEARAGELLMGVGIAIAKWARLELFFARLIICHSFFITSRKLNRALYALKTTAINDKSKITH